MAIDKVKAEQLRLDGKSYQEVADEMGCSVAWCKKNLKGVKQPNVDKALIETVRELGRSAVGVTTGEIKMHTMQKYHDLKGKELEEKVQDIRKRAGRDNPDVIVRPYWMLPDCPQECTTALMDYAQELYSLKEHLADKYRQQFDMDDSFTSTVTWALTMLSAGDKSKLMPQGLNSYCDTLSKIQDALDSRNNPQYTKQIVTEAEVYESIPCFDEVPAFVDFDCTEDDFILFAQLGTEVY